MKNLRECFWVYGLTAVMYMAGFIKIKQEQLMWEGVLSA